MSSIVMRMRLHKLFLQLPRTVAGHQLLPGFMKSCPFSDAADPSSGSWYKTTQESSAKQRRFEKTTTDEVDFEHRDSRLPAVKKPRITKPTKPKRDTRMSETPGSQRSFGSSRDTFEDDEPNFWPTQVRRNRTNSGQERFSGSQKNFGRIEQRSALENSVRSGKWSAGKEGKSYNYGLTGLGKELPQKVKAGPVVKGEILYGIHCALLALTAGRREFHRLYIRDTLVESDRPTVLQLMSLVREKAIKFEVCSKDLLTSLSQARPHQGVCLDVGRLDYETLDSDGSNCGDSPNDASKPRLFVILDSVQDPMNLGAVIRSSYFLGVDQLFVVKENSCSLTPVVSKSSAGVMEIDKVYAITNLSEFLVEYKRRGWDLLGTTGSAKSNPDQVVSLQDVSLKRNTILILGNEGSGLTEAIESQCDRLVTIPSGRSLHPLVDCLNVSVATGIILHHLCQLKSSTKTAA